MVLGTDTAKEPMETGDPNNSCFFTDRLQSPSLASISCIWNYFPRVACSSTLKTEANDSSETSVPIYQNYIT